MKLYNYTSLRFGIVLFLLLTVWAGIFYWSMLDEIYDSLEDGLDNQKLLVIQKAEKDSTVLYRDEFGEGYYRIKEIPYLRAKDLKDTYVDTLMYVMYEEDMEPFRMLKSAFEQEGKYYELHVITSMVEEDDQIANLFFSVILLYLGLMVSIHMLNNFLLKKTWKPFYQVMDWLKRFRLDHPLPIGKIDTRIDEFRLLSESVVMLLERNISVYNDQKQFIENASHELQTPLAISLNKLELLVENFEHDEEELKVIASVMDNLQRLTRLNKSLLLLSRINNKQFSEDSEVDFYNLAQKVAEDFSDQAEYRSIKITLLQNDKCVKKMDAELARILVTNLLKNAIFHNHEGGFVNITVNQNDFVVVNSGQPSPLDRSKIFDRFHKGRASESSTGLGLAIAKAILDLYGFSIRYHFQEQHIIKIIF